MADFFIKFVENKTNMNSLISRCCILFLAILVLIVPNVNAQDKAEVGKKKVDHIVKVGAGGLL
ncbi:MAG: hypothetical protein II157_07000, partial [Bacteroidales bacterium]|nr:hypothetical protein [Bacteroidales bacterium]